MLNFNLRYVSDVKQKLRVAIIADIFFDQSSVYVKCWVLGVERWSNEALANKAVEIRVKLWCVFSRPIC